MKFEYTPEILAKGVEYLGRIGSRDFEPMMTKLREALAEKRERIAKSPLRLKPLSERTPEELAAMNVWIDRHGRIGDPVHDARMQRNVDASCALWQEKRVRAGRVENER